MTPIFKLTDGTTEIDLLQTGGNAFYLNSWRPKIPQFKGGGTWNASSLADGRQMAQYRWGNVVESLDMKLADLDPDALILQTQELRRLLKKAVDYWTTVWQNDPVWIEVRADQETNSRYALVYSWSTPEDENPFSQPFLQPSRATVFDNFTLTLERGHWMEHEPGDSTCVQISSPGVGHEDAFPTGGSDDAYVTVELTAISVGPVAYFYGHRTSQHHHCGIRFRDVDVPAGARILRAFVRYRAAANNAGTTCDAIVKTELNASPAIFSTYADFMGRDRSDGVEWDSVPAETSGTYYGTPDIASEVQSVVDLSGWASGNDMVVFIEDNGSDDGAYRQPTGLSAALGEPELYIAWELDEETCDNEVFVANRHNDATLTHIYIDDGGVIGSNLLGSGVPYDLLPAAPAAGGANTDAVYFGCETAGGNSGTFPNLIFDLSSGFAGTTATGVWEWYQGAAFVAITEQDHTGSLGNTGVNGVFWDFDNNNAANKWASGNLNTILGYGPNVTAFWIRFRVTGAAAITSIPTQQNRDVYTQITPEIDVASDQVPGDIPALIHLFVHNWSGSDAGDALGNIPVLHSDTIFVARRSLSRGEDFRMFLNFSDEQNPTGLTVSAPAGAASISNDDYAPSGRAIIYNPVGAQSDYWVATMQFEDSLTQNFYGKYRAFVRFRQVGGTSGDFYARLTLSTKTVGTDVFFTSETVRIDPVPGRGGGLTHHYMVPIDFGIIQIPPVNTVLDTDVFVLFQIRIICDHAPAGADGDLHVIDLILLPIDEWACEISVPFILTTTPDAFRPLSAINRFISADMNAIEFPKSRRRGMQRRYHPGGADDLKIDQIIHIRTNGDFSLSPNVNQRLYFFAWRRAYTTYLGGGGLSANATFSEPNIVHSVQAWRSARYLSMRGNR